MNVFKKASRDHIEKRDVDLTLGAEENELPRELTIEEMAIVGGAGLSGRDVDSQ